MREKFQCDVSDSLRALYLGDNEFEYLSPEIGNLKNLQLVCDICSSAIQQTVARITRNPSFVNLTHLTS